MKENFNNSKQFDKTKRVLQNKILMYLKNRGSSNVNWSSIVQKFNLRRKNRYDQRLVEEIKKWYNNQIFNQRNFSLSQEKYQERLKLCKRQGKSLLINSYLKNRKPFDSLLSWSEAKKKCLSGSFISNYNQKEWEPVREWYINTYFKIQIKQGFLITEENFQNNLGFSSKIFGKDVTLSEIFIDMLQSFEKEVLKEKDIEVKKYYNNFFECFNAKNVINNLVNNRTLVKKRIAGFKQVKNSEMFIKYLQTTPGLYQKLCLWTIQNPFPDKARSQSHHIVPEFLHKLPEFNITLNQLNPANRQYNFATVSWIVHFLLHYCRLIEYGQKKDIDAINALGITSSKENTASQGYLDPSKAIGNFYKTFLKNRDSGQLAKLLDSDLEFRLASNPLVVLNVSRMSNRVKDILTRDTVWRHKAELNNSPSNQLSEFVFKGKPPDQCSEMDLAIAICKAYNKRIKKFNSKKKERNTLKQYNSTRDILSLYLRGKLKDQFTVHGFYLVNNRPDNIRAPESNQKGVALRD